MQERIANQAAPPPGDFQQRFHKDGFVVYEDMYSQDEIARMRGDIESMVDQTDRWPSNMFHWDAGTSLGSKPTAIQAGHLYDWRFFEWARDDRILNVLRPILGDDLAVYNTSVFMKPPQSSAIVPWHQDQIYYAVTTELLIACWVALTDVTIANGALKYVPGSHRHGILPTERPTDPEAASAFDRTVTNVSVEKAVDVPLRAGSAVFHHSLTVHSSGPNQADGPRWGLAMDFMKADYQFNGNAEARRVYPIVCGKRVAR